MVSGFTILDVMMRSANFSESLSQLLRRVKRESSDEVIAVNSVGLHTVIVVYIP